MDPCVRWLRVPSRSGRAALRAITEAAQSRLTAIAGSRDDFSLTALLSGSMATD